MADVAKPREEELIRLASEGDQDAFEELVLAYHGPLFAFFCRSTMDRQNAENLLQETFLRIHRFAASYDPTRPARSWIFSIAANLLKDHAARPSRVEAPTADLEATAPAPGPESEALRHETRERVAAALLTLSEKHRTVFLLKHFHGLRYEEIGTLMGCTVGTVKSRMHYACRELQGKLRERTPRKGEAA